MATRHYIPGINVQGRGLRGPKGEPGEPGIGSIDLLAYQATSAMTNYASTVHSHSGAGSYSTSGDNATLTYDASGIHVSVAPPAAAANSVYTVAGGYASLSIDGISTTVSVTGVQSSGAYLTTAAQSSHTHTDYVHASVSSQWITTAADPLHNHDLNYLSLSASDNYFYTASNTFANSTHIHGGLTTSSVSSNNVTYSSASNGLTLGIPALITTAAQVSHTHGSVQGVNLTAVSSSSGLTLSVDAAPIGPGVWGNNVDWTVNTAGISFDGGRYLHTTQGFSAGVTHGNTLGNTGMVTDELYFAGGDNITLSQQTNVGGDATITIIGEAGGGNNLSFSGNTTGTMTEISSGTATFAGGDNITLSQDGNAVTIIGAASGTDAGIAFSLSTANTSGTKSLISAGTVYFEGGDNITVSQNSNTIAFAGGGGTGFASSSTDGADIKGTINSTGLSLDVPVYVVSSDSGAFYLTANSSLLVPTANSTLFYPAANSTEMFLDAFSSLLADETHIHGAISTSGITGTAITNSSNSAGLTLGIPAYVTNSVAGAHTHGASVITTQVSGSLVSFSSASDALTMSIPAYITSAAGASHSHGAVSLSLVSLSGDYSSASNGLTLSLTGENTTNFIAASDSGDYVNTSQSGNMYFSNANGMSWGSDASGVSTTITGSVDTGYAVGSGTSTSALTSGSVPTLSLNTAGMTMGVPEWITTAAAGGGVGTGFSTAALTSGSTLGGSLDTAGMTLSVPAWLTTAAGGTGGVGQFTFGGNVEGASTASGSTILLYGGDNITLSGANASQIRIDGPQGSVAFADGNGVLFSTSANGASTTVSASVDTSGLTAAGVLESYSGTISVTQGVLLDTATDANHWLQAGELAWNTTANQRMGNVYVTPAGAQIFQGNQTITNSSLATHVGNYIRAGNNRLEFDQERKYFYTSATHTSIGHSNDYVKVRLDVDNGLYYSNVFGYSNSNSWSTNDDWIPNKKWISDNIVGGTGGGADWSVSSTDGSAVVISTGAATNTLYQPPFLTIAAGAGVAIKGSGTYTQNSGTIELANSNGLTFGLSNNGTLTASHNAYSASSQLSDTFMNVNQSSNFAGVGSGITGGTMTYNTDGLTMSITHPSGDVIFSNGSGVTFGTATSVNSTTVTASIAEYVSAWNISEGGGSTAGTSSSAVDGMLLVAGAGIMISAGSDGITIQTQ